MLNLYIFQLLFSGQVGEGPKSMSVAKTPTATFCGACLNINAKASKSLKMLKIKGICKEETEIASFDTDYYVDGLKNGRIHLK